MRLRSLPVVVAMFSLLVGGVVAQDVRPTTQRRSGGDKEVRKDQPSTKRAPKMGESAPLFTLKILNSEQEVNLRTVLGKRPVVLFFGSYT